MARPGFASIPPSLLRTRRALQTLRTLLLVATLLAFIVAIELSSSARSPPAVSALPSIFRGSGCRSPQDAIVQTKFDELGGMIHVYFPTPFAASSGDSGRLVRLTCNGVIPLIVEAGKRVGITQIRIAGRVDVESSAATALLTTEYFFPWERVPSMQHRFLPHHGDQAFVIDKPSGTIWSKCGGSATFRVNAALTTSGTDAEILMAGEFDDDGLVYDVVVKDCIADPRREL